jgi:hypothetical protein
MQLLPTLLFLTYKHTYTVQYTVHYNHTFIHPSPFAMACLVFAHIVQRTQLSLNNKGFIFYFARLLVPLKINSKLLDS